ncbi:hypothetical protein JNL27_05925 [bacterium]|nr:hypothetical protein [bacterium]
MSIAKDLTPKKSRWKQNLIIAFVSILLTLVAMEIILRFMGFGNVETYLPDQNLIWRLMPNQDTYTKYGLKQVHINSAGLRDREFTFEKKNNTYRILILGNSCTYGWGVGQDEMYAKLIENRLHTNLNQKNFEVINGGVIGYSIAQELEYLKADGLKWNPDMIIISHTFNEGKRVNPNSPQDVKDRVFASLKIKNFMRNIALYHYVLEHNFSHQYVQLAKRITEDQSWIDESAFQLYKTNLQQIIEICRANQIQVVFLITVTKNQVLNDHIDYSKHQKAMMDIAKTNQVLIVSPLNTFRQNRKQELFLDGGHPNEFGHQLMADEIFNTVFDSSKFERYN